MCNKICNAIVLCIFIKALFDVLLPNCNNYTHILGAINGLLNFRCKESIYLVSE